MRRIVMKFGGTSVADLPRIGAVSNIIVDELNNFPVIVVVVSAMAGQTNELGKKVEDFEKRFAANFGTKYAIMVNSGSSANLLIVAALTLLQKYDFKKGDEIIVPSLGWSTSYIPFTQYGLKLKFVDIDEQTFNIDPKKIKSAISKKTKGILAINILGNPVEFKKIKEICDTNKLLLIEDNCESLGAKYGDKYTGNFGTAASHSFFFSHHIQTIEGGMITTNDKDICEYTRSLRAHGWSRDSLEKDSLSKSPSAKFKNSFNFILPGYNLRPNELNGVLGLSQLQKFPKILKARKENALIFKKLYLKVKEILFVQSLIIYKKK